MTKFDRKTLGLCEKRMNQTGVMTSEMAEIYIGHLTSPFNTPHEKMTVVNRLITLYTAGVRMPKSVGGLSRVILDHGILSHPDKSLEIRGSWSIIRLGRHWLNMTVKEIELRVKNSRL